MIHHILRYASELRDGDRFSLDHGKTWHTFARWEDGYMETYGPNPDDDTMPLPLARSTSCLVEVRVARVRISGTVLVDVKAWAAEYGKADSTVTEVAQDVRGYFNVNNIIPEHLTGVVWAAGS